FAPDKYHLIHFTKARKFVNVKATVNIQGFTEGPITDLRMLGVQVDSKLKWGPHINTTKNKATAQMGALTRLTASTWGASFRKARTIYSAVIRPAITYGCTSWYTTPGIKEQISKTKIKQLETAQNQCLCAILGAYKTTSIRVMEHETLCPLLRLKLEE
ncbi:uncharacterized protein BDZ99DRAFT_350465, partial [Mytilinidion resinicola]